VEDKDASWKQWKMTLHSTKLRICYFLVHITTAE